MMWPTMEVVLIFFVAQLLMPAIASMSSGSAKAACVRPASATCHTAVNGEECYNHVVWAMTKGIFNRASSYPGLTANSSFEDFQSSLHHYKEDYCCPLPCKASSSSSMCKQTCLHSGSETEILACLERKKRAGCKLEGSQRIEFSSGGAVAVAGRTALEGGQNVNITSDLLAAVNKSGDAAEFQRRLQRRGELMDRSLPEWTAAARRSSENPEQAFSAMDANRDGLVSSSEWTERSKALGVAPLTAWTAWRRLDHNRDSRVTAREFYEAVGQYSPYDGFRKVQAPGVTFSWKEAFPAAVVDEPDAQYYPENYVYDRQSPFQKAGSLTQARAVLRGGPGADLGGRGSA